jgi:hypothetical protein
MAEPFEVDDATVAKMKDAVKKENAGAAQAILQEVGPCGFDSLVQKTDQGLIADYQNPQKSGQKTVPPLIGGGVRQVDGSGNNEYIVNLAHVDMGVLSASLGQGRLFASYLDKSCKEKK